MVSSKYKTDPVIMTFIFPDLAGTHIKIKMALKIIPIIIVSIVYKASLMLVLLSKRKIMTLLINEGKYPVFPFIKYKIGPKKFIIAINANADIAFLKLPTARLCNSL